MADYVSNYSGDQIDEAVSRALPGGALDTGKVSVGFGYGGTMPFIAIPTNDDTDGTKFEEKLNTFLNDMGNSSVKQIIFEDYPYLSGGRFVGTLYKNTANFAVLYGVGYGANDNIVVKKLISGVWNPFELVNPPMQLGVEYRTTERYMGKPVYVCVKQFTGLTSGANFSTGITNGSTMVRYHARWNGVSIPFINLQDLKNSWSIYLNVASVNSMALWHGSDTFDTTQTLTVTMYYTKSTD